MPSIINFKTLPSVAANQLTLKKEIAAQLAVKEEEISGYHILKESIDARSRHPNIIVSADVYINEPFSPRQKQIFNRQNVSGSEHQVLIAGAGPAGLFAALRLIEQGIKPIIIERGKDVRARRRDLARLNREGILNPESNYCFGEGGAGTYSDGKLYTRSHKRGSIASVLQLLVDHGATPDILVDTHPHIGSNKLWAVVQAIRETILRLGGEVHFDTHVTGFAMRTAPERRIAGVICANGAEILGDAVILATGHSARDVIDMCVEHDVAIEAKPFALGVRIEHAQALVDEIQYHQSPRDPHLPASSYKLVCQANGRGVFSFCMCPGGLIVPAATSPGEIVVNGMSMSRRDSPFANSGTVVAIEEDDWQSFTKHGARAALEYQASVERAAFAATGDGSQRAPAQRLVDYLDGTISSSIPRTSYIPGHTSVDLRAVLPAPVDARLRAAIREFGRVMPGYLTNEAVMVGVESRTSSPVRIPRDPATREHTHVRGLFPCGEGAGYAGGIVSAALDGQNVATSIVQQVFTQAQR